MREKKRGQFFTMLTGGESASVERRNQILGMIHDKAGQKGLEHQ